LSFGAETDRKVTFWREEENGVSFRHFALTHSPLSETIDCHLPFTDFLQLWQFAGLKLAASL